MKRKKTMNKNIKAADIVVEAAGNQVNDDADDPDTISRGID
jgi:hypothetical protein